MNSCLLCLEPSTENCIPYASKLWQEENIENLIQKHLWPFKSITYNSWICITCWNCLNEFHKFFVRIEEVQKCFPPVLKTEDTEPSCYVETIIKTENVSEEEPMPIDNLSDENKIVNTDPLEKSLPTKYPWRLKPRKSKISEEKETQDANNESNMDEADEPSSQKDEDPNFEASDSYSENETDNEEESTDANNEWKPSSNPYYKSKAKRNEIDEFLRKHFKITCAICQEVMPSYNDLRTHFVKQHNEAGYAVCCGKKFFKCCLLVDHIQCHLNPEYFKCKLCGKVLSQRRCLMLHIKTHGVQEKTYACDMCDKAFSRKIGLKNHKLLHLSEEEKKFSCEHCGKAFGSQYLVSNHVRFVHLKKNDLVCDICGEKMRRKDALERHMLKHQGLPLPTVSCDECGLKVSNQHGLKRHKETQHPKGGKQEFPCHLCPKISPNLTALKKHIKDKHELGYDFKCTLCDKAYKRSSTLKEHMATHTGTTLYTCSYCPKTFNSNANMHSHRKNAHPLEWEAECREKYSGNLPPKYKLINSKIAEDKSSPTNQFDISSAHWNY
ncbi:transcription factor grauzone-like [Haematobia irritans]|uniref:transcription factor grauzone-like n=1 Tax=Haematobia irritans TaxID=7368 RepID=UPI003F509F58